MKDLTREDLVAICQSPEMAALRISPQLLLELWGTRWFHADGSSVVLEAVKQYDDGELLAQFRRDAPIEVPA